MKRGTDVEYTMVLDALEDPTVKTFSTITDAIGNPLVATTYMFKVKARNIVGFGELSDALSVTLAMKTSNALSVITGQGIVESFGAVTNSITVQAVDEEGSNRVSGGDVFFLYVEQLCYVTDNFRCDLSLT